jgi:hypothetical protein
MLHLIDCYAEYCYAEYCYAEYCYADYCYAEYCYAEYCYAEYCYADGDYADCRYAECYSEYLAAWSAKANGREPKSCLGQVFNFELGCFYSVCYCKV